MKPVTIKNYTSTVPVDRTVGRIEDALVKAGATGIIKDYQGGQISALCFRLLLPTKKVMAVRLPANEKSVYDRLLKARARPWNVDEGRLRDQARRTAWKLMQDWVEVQLSLIELHQVEPMQVFLAYAWDGQRTFYEALRDNNFKALPGINVDAEVGQ